MADPVPPPRCELCGEAHAAKACPTLIRRSDGMNPTPHREPPPADSDAMLGREIGGYELIAVLGTGSFGTVYRAEHRVGDRQVALKLLHAHLASDPEMVRRFVGEARATTLVHHENVIQVLDINLIETSRYYMVLELLEGETLDSRCARGPIPFEEAGPIVRQICEGLAAAHGVGIIHRDLKPENVYLVNNEGKIQAKVMDFGVARRQHLSAGEKRTARGVVLGTPEYLAPEQSMGVPVDERSDIYSVGVILYRMLTGKLPFTGKTPFEMMTAHQILRPPKPTKALPGLNPALDDVVLKALEKDPAARYQSMDELEAAIAGVSPQTDAPAKGSSTAILTLIGGLEASAPEDHYQLLGVRHDAATAEIRAALQRLATTLGAKSVSGSAELHPRVEAARARIAHAEETLVDPRARARYDASRGNFVGVARAVTDGLDPIALAGLRREFLADHPQLSRAPEASAEVAGLMERDSTEASAVLAKLLTDDPLNLELHRQYWALKKRLRRAG